MTTEQTQPEPVALARSVPVTALFRVDDSRILLAGQGSTVRVFTTSGKSTRLHCSTDLLGSATIHGFASLGERQGNRLFVAWGWNFLRAFRLTERSAIRPWTLETISPIFDVNDWVLSLCSLSKDVNRKGSDVLTLLDAHNEVRTISYDISKLELDFCLLPKNDLERKPVMLYAGHCSMIDGRFVVAAGTMFGQVLFDAYEVIQDENIGSTLFMPTIRTTFHDHEGSVFGVRVLERRVIVRGQPQYRLASCSDDRTLRAYEVTGLSTDLAEEGKTSRTGFTDCSNKPMTKPCADSGWIMGHESRIWSVLWLESGEAFSQLMTLGEDATAQLWRVRHAIDVQGQSRGGTSMRLELDQRFGFHIGKNIWAACSSRNADDSVELCTGGADGRIASFSVKVFCHEEASTQDATSMTLTQDRISRLPSVGKEQETYEAGAEPRAAEIFSSLQGSWSLKRTIVSQRSDYPSGSFEGKATFSKRTATHEEYDSEMLYEEQGILVLASGISFPARRNYVYRLRSNTITAWFVKSDEPEVVDYLFHQVHFQRSGHGQAPQADEVELASGYHLCVADHYNATYEFPPGRDTLNKWKLSYKVQGPQKDYVATSAFSRVSDSPARPQSGKAHQAKARKSKSPKPDSFRSYAWLTDTKCLITTDHGRVMTATIDQSSEMRSIKADAGLDLQDQLPVLSSYSLTCVLDSNTALIAAGNGDLFLYNGRTREVQKPCLHHFESKIIALIALGDARSAVIKCLGQSSLHLVNLSSDEKHLSIADAEVPKNFLPTSACLRNDGRILLIGSRADGLSIWRLDRDAQQILKPATQCQNLPLHGQDAITSIHPLSSTMDIATADSSVFGTTGRDGTVQVHRLLDDQKRLETIHAIKWAYGPYLEGASIGPHVILWGFDGTEFVAINHTANTEILRIACGNSHRNWAFKLRNSHESDLASSFVWTQAGSCHFRVQDTGSHRPLTAGGHGREMKALATAGIGSQQLVATGAEDTDVKLFMVPQALGARNETRIQPLQFKATLARHETGITHLSFDGAYLFSGGGKEELMMWKIQPLPEPFGLGVSFQAECPKVENGLLRVTDFCFLKDAGSPKEEGVTKSIAVVYSDSSLRIWHYTVDQPSFQLAAYGRYATKCLTCVNILDASRSGTLTVLITASTDGNLIVWEAAVEAVAGDGSHCDDLTECKVVSTFRAHGSAIKAMCLQPLGLARFLVMTGGDDGSVVFTILIRGDDGKTAVAKQTRVPRAHAASVNALSLVECKANDTSVAQMVLASTGSDQKVTSWNVKINGTLSSETDCHLSIQRRSQPTAVADASGLVYLDEGALMVAGVGSELIDSLASELN